MSYYTYNGYLMHYGVKGMKWGVRHDRAPTFTSKQRKQTRYVDEKQRRRKKIARGALAAAAILSAATVVAVEKKKLNLMRPDTVLKAGTTIQNIGAPNKNFKYPFYAVSDPKDKLYYLKAFSKAPTRRDPIGRTTVTVLNNKNDVRVAGKDAMDAAYKAAYGNNKIKRELFYRRLGGLKPYQKSKFNNELIKRGYGAHKDINDMQVVFGGDTPMVFFGGKSGYSKTKSTTINIKAAKKIKVLTGVGKRTLQEGSALAVGTASVYGMSKTAVDSGRRKSVERNKRKK